ncbi:unnamed protein product [Rotaria sordida]|uniref:NHL repeat containing protein n=1 Tax=Rotaria sordida TaxID=392033 RepID=A0A819TPZ8_9BILA|nr:unnamed protein product [Rotaria sordida]
MQALSCSLQWNSIGTTVAGDANGAAGVTQNRLRLPNDVSLDSSNTLYIADSGNNRIQKWLAGANIGATVAGQANGTEGTAANQLNDPQGVVVDSSGNVYVAENSNNRVQFWPPAAAQGKSIVSTGLSLPIAITRNANTGILYVTDSVANSVVQIDPVANTTTTVAGGNGAGNATNQLDFPNGIYFDSATNSLVIANTDVHNIVRWFIGNNTAIVLAGTAGISGNTSTLLDTPFGVTFDSMGNMYVADTGNNRIQFFRAGQTVGTTIAGTGTAGTGASSLNTPSAVRLDNQGNLVQFANAFHVILLKY